MSISLESAKKSRLNTFKHYSRFRCEKGGKAILVKEKFKAKQEQKLKELLETAKL
jgi:hypothetical protein